MESREFKVEVSGHYQITFLSQCKFKSLTKEKCFKKEIASKVFETQFI